MSLGYEVKLRDIQEILSQDELQVKDIIANKEAITIGLCQAKDKLLADSDPEQRKRGRIIDGLLATVNQINRLTDLGVEVCIAAGNEGRDSINILALSKEAHLVGVDEYFQNPEIVTDKQSGVVNIVPVADSNHNTGYDVNNDGVIDILKDLSKVGIPVHQGTIKKLAKTESAQSGIYNQADAMRSNPGDENYEFFKERYYEYGNQGMNQGYYFKINTSDGERLILGDIKLRGTSYAAPRLVVDLAKKGQ